MAWRVITEPTSEPVTLEEAKAHLRVDTTDHDSEIEALIASARQYIELTCNRALMPQEWEITLPEFDGEVRLPGNVRSITSVKYYDSDNTEQTLTDYFEVLAEPAKIAPDTVWPYTYSRPDAVAITAQVGYEDADSVPGPLKSAIKLHMELVFDRPSGETAKALERARDALLFPYRDMGAL